MRIYLTFRPILSRESHNEEMALTEITPRMHEIISLAMVNTFGPDNNPGATLESVDLVDGNLVAIITYHHGLDRVGPWLKSITWGSGEPLDTWMQEDLTIEGYSSDAQFIPDLIKATLDLDNLDDY